MPRRIKAAKMRRQKVRHIRRLSPKLHAFRLGLTVALLLAVVVSMGIYVVRRIERVQSGKNAIEIRIGENLAASIKAEDISGFVTLADVLAEASVMPTTMQSVELSSEKGMIRLPFHQAQKLQITQDNGKLILLSENGDKIGRLKQIVLPTGAEAVLRIEK